MNGRQIVLGFAFLLVTGCGGGGGGSGSDSTAFDDVSIVDNNITQLQNANGRLRGLYFSSTKIDTGEWLNLETGETGSLFGTFLGDPPPNLEAIVPAPYGTEYLELHANGGFGAAGSATIQIKSWQTGLIIDEFQVRGEVLNSTSNIQFSPDGQIIALKRVANGNFDDSLAFFRRNGDLIAEFEANAVGAFDWMPDGRIAFFRDKELRIAQLAQGSISSTPLTSTENIIGIPSRLSTSPDGQFFVFEIVTETPPLFALAVDYRAATVWRVATDGSGMQVATMADTNGQLSESPQINNPLWTLDGNHLFMSVGVSSTPSIDGSYGVASNIVGYELAYTNEALVSRSDGFIYVLPQQASNVVFLGNNEFPVIAANSEGQRTPYLVPSSHITAGATLVEPIRRLEETVAAPTGASGSLVYLKRTVAQSQFENELTLMQFNTESQQEEILIQIHGIDFDDDRLFGISNNKQLIAHWNEVSIDEKYLNIYDAAGNELVSYRLVVESDSVLGTGLDLSSAPKFSPVNNNLLLFSFDVPDQDISGIAVFDWAADNVELLFEGDYASVAWAPDGTVIASLDKDLFRFNFTNNTFTDPQRILTTQNTAEHIDINADGTKMLFTMSGHIFHSNLDGTNLVQVTAPSTGYESDPVWSPDSNHIMFRKNRSRHVISAQSRNLRVDDNIFRSSNKLTAVTLESGEIGQWLP